MRGCLCEICKREVGNLRNVRQREVGHSNKNTLSISSFCTCAGQVRGGKGRLIRELIAVELCRLLQQTKALKLLSDTIIASISKKANISRGQTSVDAIKLV